MADEPVGPGDAVKNAKEGFPDSAPGATESCQPAKKPATPPVVQCVTQIKAKTPGTNGVRKATDKRPDNILTASGSSDKSLDTNAPVVLIRGCKDVELEAVTTPPNTAVAWKVEANENTESPPAISPASGVKATLKTNVQGSFSVIATLGGCKVVWNVIFVWVNVDVASSAISKFDDKYADSGSGGGWTQFTSGQDAPGQYAWEAKVNLKLVGGGNDNKRGIDKVKLHVLQNGVTDTLTGHYAPPPAGATVKEVPKGGLPIVDANDASSPFGDHPGKFTPDADNVKWEVWTADPPAGSFASKHPNTHKALTSVSGVNGFKSAIASLSTDAPNTIMVHAETAWASNFSGTVDAAGTYTPNGAKTTADAAYKLIAAGTGGTDAQLGRYETFEPRFNNGTEKVANP